MPLGRSQGEYWIKRGALQLVASSTVQLFIGGGTARALPLGRPTMLLSKCLVASNSSTGSGSSANESRRHIDTTNCKRCFLHPQSIPDVSTVCARTVPAVQRDCSVWCAESAIESNENLVELAQEYDGKPEVSGRPDGWGARSKEGKPTITNINNRQATGVKQFRFSSQAMMNSPSSSPISTMSPRRSSRR